MKTQLYKTLHPHTLGFERLFNDLDRFASNNEGGYPPYNVIAETEDSYTVELAVAGFSKDDLSIEEHNGNLTIRGAKKDEEEDTRNYAHKGISSRKFERTFALAEHVHVTDAVVENGMLSVSLVREVPEALKPRSIEIAFKG